MFRTAAMLAALAFAASLQAATDGREAKPDPAMAAVEELGRINGMALACNFRDVSQRAKALMLAHVPKLRHWGEVYEQATHAAFVAPPGECGDAVLLRVRLEVVAIRLKSLLPASPPPTDVPVPDSGIMPRYLLVGPNGRAVMDSDFRGRYQLITFGYTYCPDICPTTLVEMAQALRQLGDDARRVQPLFISVDPERDTPEQLKAYTEFFDPRILGLTGTEQAVRKIADLFKVRFEKVLEPGAAHYSMDHTAGMYLIGPDGVFVTKFAYGTPVADVVERMRSVMSTR